MEQQPEIKDIILSIRRYLALNPDASVVYAFVTPLAGEDGEVVDADMTKSTLGAVGHIEELRQSLEILRTMAEEEIDEYGYVQVVE